MVDPEDSDAVQRASHGLPVRLHEVGNPSILPSVDPT